MNRGDTGKPTLVSAAPPFSLRVQRTRGYPNLGSDPPFPPVEPRLAAELSSIPPGPSPMAAAPVQHPEVRICSGMVFRSRRLTDMLRTPRSPCPYHQSLIVRIGNANLIYSFSRRQSRSRVAPAPQGHGSVQLGNDATSRRTGTSLPGHMCGQLHARSRRADP